MADTYLTPKVAAERLGVHRRWLDRRWRRLPYCHPLDDDPTTVGYRGRLRMAVAFEIRGGKIAMLDIIADRERLARLDLALLEP